ncbi:LuxR C-terminal-related transcriptional regulator [Brachybacterium hainanense]|uniref:LuxR C-terminal-related transcriptional regulator n=1 Tax=Brachybacterium hainanense TaxID=1541174 RepID=A0ABV6R8G9_9MICO
MACSAQPGAGHVFLLDDDRFRDAVADDGTSAGALLAAWQRGRADLIRLARLPDREIAAIVDAEAEGTALEDLRRSVLVRLAEGAPLLARALVADALEDPEGVPRRYPVAGVDPFAPGPRALALLKARHAGISPGLRAAACRLSLLGTLPRGTAMQLVGAATLAELLARRLATTGRAHGIELITVSPLHAAAVIALDGPAEERARDRGDPDLERQWRRGSGLGPGATLRLVGAIPDADRLTGPEAALVLDGARIANRLGDPHAALGHCARLLDRCTDPTMRQQAHVEQLRALVLSGRHIDAAELARTLLAHAADRSPGSPGADVVFHAGLALSWSQADQQAWRELQESTVCGGLPEMLPVLEALATSEQPGAQLLIRLEQTAADAGADLCVRLLSATFAALARQRSAREPELVEDLAQGMELVHRIQSRSGGSPTVFDMTCIHYFDVIRTITLRHAGLAPQEALAAEDELLHRAAEPSLHADWHQELAAALVVARRRHRAGEDQLSRAAMAAARQIFRPAIPLFLTRAITSVDWFIRATAAVQPPEGHGAEALAASWTQEGPATVIPDSMSPQQYLPELGQELAQSASWLRTARLHTVFLRGAITAGEALATLPEPGKEPLLPLETLLRRHLRAAAAGDADGLLLIGRELREAGMLEAARHALQQARAGFIDIRAAARAAEAAELLADLEGGSGAVPAGASAGGADGAAALSPSELAVCKLIGDGLTNTQIAMKLFISPRTVDSHVLSARAKLGARRKRDIPGLLRPRRPGG